MKYTEEQWAALCKLRLLSSPGRQRTSSTMALREILMDGIAPIEAAKRHGVTRQAVQETLGKTRECVATSRVLAGAPDI